MAPSKVEIIYEAKPTLNEAKKSFGASAGGSRNNERYNPRKRKFSQGNDRNRVENRGSETRWSRNSGNDAPTRERVQNSPQILENRTVTIPPCTLCKRIHSGQCRYGISCFTCGLPGHYARDCSSQESRVAMLAPAARGRPNAQICGINEGDVGAGPSTSALDLAKSREISKIDFRSCNRQ